MRAWHAAKEAVVADGIALGAGAVVNIPEQTTTMPAGRNDLATIVAHRGGDVAPRLQQAGIDPVAVDTLLLRHEHPTTSPPFCC